MPLFVMRIMINHSALRRFCIRNILPNRVKPCQYSLLSDKPTRNLSCIGCSYTDPLMRLSCPPITVLMLKSKNLSIGASLLIASPLDLVK